VEVRTSEPLLWYGRLVDFGSFEESASSHNRRKTVEFELSLHIEASFTTPYRIRTGQAEYLQAPCTVSFSVVPGSEAEGTPTTRRIESYVDRLSLALFDAKVELRLKGPNEIGSLRIDEQDVTLTAISSYRVMKATSPTPTFYSRVDPTETEEDQSTLQHHPSFHQQLHGLVRTLTHNRTSDESLSQLTEDIRLGSAEEILKSIQDASEERGFWRKHVLAWTTHTPEFQQLRHLLWGARLEQILDSVSDALQRDFTGISNITPLRAAAERYYRQQGLAVNELDSKGENFALFLRSLTNRDRESLREWLASALGVYVDLEESRGHVSLYLVDEKTRVRVNLADTGFGYSQLLPVAIQLWLTQTRGRRRVNPYSPRFTRPINQLVAIEQPELHLHPRIQAKVADLLAKVASTQPGASRRMQVRTLVETHSEALVNRLGKLVHTGVLAPSDVNVVLFNKPSFLDPSEVSSTTFDANGFLEDWPIGFFNAE
jgi:hypothetical protein